MPQFSLKPVEMTDKEQLYPVRKAKHGDLVARFGAHVKGGTFNNRGELILYVVVDPPDVDFAIPLTKDPGYTFTWNVRKRKRNYKGEMDVPPGTEGELADEADGEPADASTNGDGHIRSVLVGDHEDTDAGEPDPWELVDE